MTHLVCSFCRKLIMPDKPAVDLHAPKIPWVKRQRLVLCPECFCSARFVQASSLAAELSAALGIEENPSSSRRAG